MMRRFPVPRPTENQAIGRASRCSTQAVPVTELRHRLLAAVQAADGYGALLLSCHIRRAAG